MTVKFRLTNAQVRQLKKVITNGDYCYGEEYTEVIAQFEDGKEPTFYSTSSDGIAIWNRQGYVIPVAPEMEAVTS